MPADDPRFGFELFKSLNSRRRGKFVLGGFNYARLQQLKAANRSETLKLLRGRGFTYAMVQRLKQGTPDEVAELLLEHQREQQKVAAAGMLLYWMWAIFLLFG